MVEKYTSQEYIGVIRKGLRFGGTEGRGYATRLGIIVRSCRLHIGSR